MLKTFLACMESHSQQPKFPAFLILWDPGQYAGWKEGVLWDAALSGEGNLLHQNLGWPQASSCPHHHFSRESNKDMSLLSHLTHSPALRFSVTCGVGGTPPSRGHVACCPPSLPMPQKHLANLKYKNKRISRPTSQLC